MTTLWVPVDTAGPIGAFDTETAARDAYAPYLAVRWRGILLRFTPNTFVGPGDEVCFLFPYEGSVPLFVAGAEEAQRVHAQLDTSGVLEPSTDLRFRCGVVGEILPSAKMRLDPLLKKSGEADGALNLFMRLAEADMSTSLDEKIDNMAEEDPCPVAAFIIETPIGSALDDSNQQSSIDRASASAKSSSVASGSDASIKARSADAASSGTQNFATTAKNPLPSLESSLCGNVEDASASP
jgi:hypothetical protein